MSNNTFKRYSYNSDKTAIILQIIEDFDRSRSNVDFDVCDSKGRKLGSQVSTWVEKVVSTQTLPLEEAQKEMTYIPFGTEQPELLFCSNNLSTRDGKVFGSGSFFSKCFRSEDERTKHINKYLTAAKKKAVKKSQK